MTRLQAVGVLLVALGLIYALLYVGWVRKQRRHASAAVAAQSGEESGGQPGGRAAAAAPVTGDRLAGLVAEGTYVSTTTAASRLERVAVQGLGNRSKATLTVRRGDLDQLVRIERKGESTVVIPASRLLAVRRDRGMAGKFVGSMRLLVIAWRADDRAVYETGFLPRYRADVERVESALWWHSGGREDPHPVTPASSSGAETPAEPTPAPTEGEPAS